MNKFLYPILHFNIKPWIKYWIYNKEAQPAPVYPLSEIITGASPLTLINSVRKNFNIFNISGNTIQDGTPTPESPIPVENVSGEVEVKVENKNIYNSSLEVNNMYQNYNNPYWSMSPNNSYWCTGLQKIKPNTNYTISTTPNITVCYDKDRNPIPQGLRGAKITTQATAYYMNCCYTKNSLPFGSDLQIEQGSTATSYEPHEEQTATLHLPEGMEMCKIGDYKDSFVYQGGKWYKNKVIGSSGVSASWAWDKNQDSPDGNYISFMAYEAPWKKASTNSLCNYFVTGYWNTISQKNGNYCWNNGSAVGGFRIHKDYLEGYDASMTNAQKIALFKTWLRNHSDLKVYYKLNTSVLEEITDTTLISDLESLKNLYSYSETTYISSTNEPSPVFEIQYYMEGE